MENLRSIVERAHARSLRAGGAVSTELIKNLRGLRKRQLVVFIALEALVLLGVAFCAYWLTRSPNNVRQVELLSGLIGVGAGGGIEVMRRIWKEWSQAELLLILIGNASESQVTELIDKLTDKL